MIVAFAVVALEYCLAFGLPFRRTRRYLVLPGLAFHAIIYVTLPVYTFSATMALLYLAYFDADAVDRVIARLQGIAPAGPRSTGPVMRRQFTSPWGSGVSDSGSSWRAMQGD